MNLRWVLIGRFSGFLIEIVMSLVFFTPVLGPVLG